jgi:hypothetical protein
VTGVQTCALPIYGYRIKTLNLRQIMRQKEGNPIIESSVKIRKNISNSNSGISTSNKINQIGEGIEFINLNSLESRSSFRTILEKYYKTDRFSKDSEYCKVIGWRNKTISSMNDLVSLGNSSCKGCITGMPFSLILMIFSSFLSCFEQEVAIKRSALRINI